MGRKTLAIVAICVGFFLIGAYFITSQLSSPKEVDTCGDDIRNLSASELAAVPLDEFKTRLEQAVACNARAELQKNPDEGEWLVVPIQDEMTDERGMIAVLSAKREVQIGGYLTTRPRLAIRCKAKVTKVFIDFGAHITARNDTRLRLRLGEEAARYEVWDMALNHKAAGVWTNREAISFVKSLLGQERFLVEVTPEGESSTVVAFDLTGIETAVASVREKCNW